MSHCAIFVVFPASLISAQDPCDNNLLMEDLDDGRRSPNTTSSIDFANLCDYQL